MKESNDVADLNLLILRLLRRREVSASSFNNFFAKINDFSLERERKTNESIIQEENDNVYLSVLVVVVDRISFSGMDISGAKRNWPFNNPFLIRSGLTFAAD